MQKHGFRSGFSTKKIEVWSDNYNSNQVVKSSEQKHILAQRCKSEVDSEYLKTFLEILCQVVSKDLQDFCRTIAVTSGPKFVKVSSTAGRLPLNLMEFTKFSPKYVNIKRSSCLLAEILEYLNIEISKGNE